MIRRALAILVSAVFLVIAPGFVAGLAPYWISHWQVRPPFFGMSVFRIAGGALFALGAIGLLDSFVRFAVQGIGTPAPVFPTRHLVVSGLYRYVRNPMYVAVVSAILGQALIFGSVRLLGRDHLDSLSPVRAGLRRADAKGNLRRGVQAFLPGIAPLDSTRQCVEGRVS